MVFVVCGAFAASIENSISPHDVWMCAVYFFDLSMVIVGSDLNVCFFTGGGVGPVQGLALGLADSEADALGFLSLPVSAATASRIRTTATAAPPMARPRTVRRLRLRLFSAMRRAAWRSARRRASSRCLLLLGTSVLPG